MRITIESEELEAKLNLIKGRHYEIRNERGLEGTVAWLVQDHETRKSVEELLIDMRQEVRNLVKSEVAAGVTEAWQQLINNLFKMGGPEKS